MDATVTILSGQTALAHVVGLNAAGQPVPFSAPPGWAVDHPELLTITPAADGTSCLLTVPTPAAPGTAVVTITDTADPTVPHVTITATIELGKITTLKVTVDPPTP